MPVIGRIPAIGKAYLIPINNIYIGKAGRRPVLAIATVALFVAVAVALFVAV